MYACPSCGERTIRFVSKWLSSSAMPAKCSACKAGCAIATVNASGILAGSAIVLTLFGFLAAAVQAVYPLVVGGAVVGAFYFWRQHRAGLVLVSAAEQELANRSAWAMFLLWLFPSLFS